jgi:hypothetical protein
MGESPNPMFGLARMVRDALAMTGRKGTGSWFDGSGAGVWLAAAAGGLALVGDD